MVTKNKKDLVAFGPFRASALKPELTYCTNTCTLCTSIQVPAGMQKPLHRFRRHTVHSHSHDLLNKGTRTLELQGSYTVVAWAHDQN